MKTTLISIMFATIVLASCTPTTPNNYTETVPTTTTILRDTEITPQPTHTPTVRATHTPTVTPTPNPTFTPTFTPSPTPIPEKISIDNLHQLSVQKVIGPAPKFTGIFSILVNPNGENIAVSGDTTALIDLQTSQVIHEYSENSLASFSSDGGSLAIATPDQTIEIWDIEENITTQVLEGHTDSVVALSWSPDDQRLASYGLDTSLIIWDLSTGEPSYQVDIPLDEWWWEIILEWSPDGNHLAVVGQDDVLRVYDGEKVASLQGHTEIVDDVDWSPDGSFLATSSTSEPAVIIWRTSNLNQVLSITNHQYWVSNVDWSPDGNYLATADAAGTVFVRNPHDGSIIQYYPNESSPLKIHWSPDGSKIAALLDGSGPQIFDITNQITIQAPDDTIGSIDNALWIPGSDRLLLKNSDNRIQIWDVSTGETEMVANPEIGRVTVISLSPTGQHFALGESGGQIHIYDSYSGEKLFTLPAFHSAVIDLSWSPDGHNLAASASWDKKVVIWDKSSGEEASVINAEASNIYLDWSTQPGLLIMGDWNGNIYTWDTLTAKKLAVWGQHEGAIRDLELSPDGTLAALIDSENLYLWDAVAGKRINILPFSGDIFLYELAWSPDGSKIATLSSSWDEFSKSTYHLIDATTFEQIQSFEMSPRANQVAWSPDGQMIALSNGEIRDSSTGQVLHENGSYGNLGWSPDGYNLFSAAHGLELWGIDPQPNQ